MGENKIIWFVFIVASHGSLTYFCIFFAVLENPQIYKHYFPLDGQYGEAGHICLGY